MLIESKCVKPLLAFLLAERSSKMGEWKSFSIPTKHRHFGNEPGTYECSEVLHFSRGEDSGLSYKSFSEEVRTLSRCTNLTALKARASRVVYPNMLNDMNCSLMILTNYDEPDWIPVFCNEKLLHIAVCVEKTPDRVQKYTNRNHLQYHEICPHKGLLKWKTCFVFFWGHTKTPLEKSCLSSDSSSAISLAAFLANAVSASLPPFIFKNSSLVVGRIPHRKLFHLYDKKGVLFSESEKEGLVVCIGKNNNIRVQGNIFACKQGRIISYLYMCDGKIDCPYDSSDEQHCVCENKWDTKFGLCKQVLERHNKTICSPLYFLTIENTCKKYITVSSKPAVYTTQVFACKRGIKIDQTLVDDLAADCGPEAEDETLLVLFLKHHKYFSCLKPSEVPCREGHSRCYNLTDICFYSLNLLNYLMPCRNGEHLQNCREFECNLSFKCSMSYLLCPLVLCMWQQMGLSKRGWRIFIYLPETICLCWHVQM